MEILTISELKQATLRNRVKAGVHVQIESLLKKETRDGKPFWEITVADAEGKMALRAWSDAPAFSHCSQLRAGTFVEVAGEFANGLYGVDSKDWSARDLTGPERDALLGGSPALREKQAADFEYLLQAIGSVRDPRLHGLCRLFLEEYGDRFRRTAAARVNHHARRGGLVEHVAQMMRAAEAVAGVYPMLNRDLLLAGVFFHDSGKLWENALPAEGFAMAYTERGELLGHIPIGVELVNHLWRKLTGSEAAKAWADLQPENEQVRLHLLHLVAAHHGDLQFGSPVVPKTPEAWALHYVDNLDAKMEMMADAYANSRPLAPTIYEKAWPLPGNLVAPLARFEGEPEGAQS